MKRAQPERKLKSIITAGTWRAQPRIPTALPIKAMGKFIRPAIHHRRVLSQAATCIPGRCCLPLSDHDIIFPPCSSITSLATGCLCFPTMSRPDQTNPPPPPRSVSDQERVVEAYPRPRDQLSHLDLWSASVPAGLEPLRHAGKKFEMDSVYSHRRWFA
jgi:hypothetical protein